MAERMREGAYSGGSQMGADWSAASRGERPAPAEDEDQGADEAPAEDDEDQGADEDEDQGADEAPARSSSLGAEGAGWVLGLLLWGWVVLPFMKGGPAQVGRVWRAKFLNQAPDGSELP